RPDARSMTRVPGRTSARSSIRSLTHAVRRTSMSSYLRQASSIVRLAPLSFMRGAFRVDARAARSARGEARCNALPPPVVLALDAGLEVRLLCFSCPPKPMALAPPSAAGFPPPPPPRRGIALAERLAVSLLRPPEALAWLDGAAAALLDLQTRSAPRALGL